MSPPRSQRICIVRTTSGRDYHFKITDSDDPNGFRLLNTSDGIRLQRHDGQEQMNFDKSQVEVVRYEEGALNANVTSWQDPIF